eukprot:TRINITY_DN27810_c0_g2_i2.p1 TRINITY_DN27810_c0_g2~~TRINITY_DN27810_c0_g2_i2.p1  ORF type:complete len:163 (+),score=21.51 TRINITY_DN27810_c0_g2_i2:117-605(+)
MAVQMGRPVVMGSPVGNNSEDQPRVVQGTVVSGPAAEANCAAPSGGPRLVQATLVQTHPQASQAPRPMVMEMSRPHAIIVHRGWAEHDDRPEPGNLLCLQLATAYACCCPCGLCVGATAHCMQAGKPEESMERKWGQYALAAGVFNLLCNVAVSVLRAQVGG